MNAKTLAAVTVFLDRDGTLNQDSGYITSPSKLVLLPGAAQAVARLNLAGIRVVLVTNQSGVARGFFTLAELHDIHEKLQSVLKAEGAWLDAIFVCSHHPEEHCWCRKPNPGLLDQAATQFGLDLTCSYVVGDKDIDLELAHRVGALGVLVMTGPSSPEALKAMESGKLNVGCVTDSVNEAVDWILQDVMKKYDGERGSGIVVTR
ncbi:MAG: HAD family hydrolase [Nitrospinae bacterium]|nr:HAD family hydrolase [Nitrospinota bacterium]